MTPLQARMLPVVAILAGLVVAVLMLFVPVTVNFSEDALLNLQSFDRQRSILPTEVNCGPAPSNVIEPEGGGSIYEIARDGACHRAGYRRFWLAIAAGTMFVSGGMVGYFALGRDEW